MMPAPFASMGNHLKHHNKEVGYSDSTELNDPECQGRKKHIFDGQFTLPLLAFTLTVYSTEKTYFPD